MIPRTLTWGGVVNTADEGLRLSSYWQPTIHERELLPLYTHVCFPQATSAFTESHPFNIQRSEPHRAIYDKAKVFSTFYFNQSLIINLRQLKKCCILINESFFNLYFHLLDELTNTHKAYVNIMLLLISYFCSCVWLHVTSDVNVCLFKLKLSVLALSLLLILCVLDCNYNSRKLGWISGSAYNIDSSCTTCKSRVFLSCLIVIRNNKL